MEFSVRYRAAKTDFINCTSHTKKTTIFLLAGFSVFYLLIFLSRMWYCVFTYISKSNHTGLRIFCSFLSNPSHHFLIAFAIFFPTPFSLSHTLCTRTYTHGGVFSLCLSLLYSLCMWIDLARVLYVYKRFGENQTLFHFQTPGGSSYKSKIETAKFFSTLRYLVEREEAEVSRIVQY